MRLRHRLAMTAASTLTAAAGLSAFGASSSSAAPTVAPAARVVTRISSATGLRLTTVRTAPAATSSPGNARAAEIAAALKACGITVNSAAPVPAARAAA